MKFIGYELRKLACVRYVRILLLLLLVANAGLSYISAPDISSGIPRENTEIMFERYYADPDGFLAEAQECAEKGSTWELFPNSGYEDYSYYLSVISASDYAASYSDDIAAITDMAHKSIAEYLEMGYDEDSFALKYQYAVIERYSPLPGRVRLGVENIRGWSEYFSYTAGDVFAALGAIVVFSVIFIQEKQSGFSAILFCSKRGRMTTIAAKLVTASLAVAGVVLAFSLISWGIFGIRTGGYSSAFNAVQMIPALRYCPQALTIGQYFVLSLLFKLLGGLTFALFVLFFSTIVYNYLLTMTGGILFYGLNLVLSALPVSLFMSPLKYLNFVTLGQTYPLLARFRAFSFFGVCNYLSAAMMVFTLLPAALTIMTVIFALKNRNAVRLPRIGRRITDYIRRIVGSLCVSSSQRRGNQATSLICFEISKIFGTALCFLLIIFALGAKFFYISDSIVQDDDFDSKLYRHYINLCAGRLDDEKEKLITDEYNFITETVRMYTRNYNNYVNGTISREEWVEYSDKYAYAAPRLNVIKRVNDQMENVKSLEAETGNAAYMLDPSGWEALAGSGRDYFLLFVCLLCLCEVFTREYSSRVSSGSMAALVRATRRGRGRLFTSKVTATLLAGIILFTLCNAIDLVVVVSRFDMRFPSAPMSSIPGYFSYFGDMTIGEFFICFYIYRLVVTLMICLVICALSALLRRTLPVFAAVILLTLTPSALTAVGLTPPAYLDFMELLHFDPRSSPVLIGSVWIYPLAVLLGFALLTLLFLTAARRTWISGRI